MLEPLQGLLKISPPVNNTGEGVLLSGNGNARCGVSSGAISHADLRRTDFRTYNSSYQL